MIRGTINELKNSITNCLSNHHYNLKSQYGPISTMVRTEKLTIHYDKFDYFIIITKFQSKFCGKFGLYWLINWSRITIIHSDNYWAIRPISIWIKVAKSVLSFIFLPQKKITMFFDSIPTFSEEIYMGIIGLNMTVVVISSLLEGSWSKVCFHHAI